MPYHSQAFIVKLDGLGGVLWHSEFGDGEVVAIEARDVVCLPSGELVIAGAKFDGSDKVGPWLLKLGQSGETTLDVKLNGPSGGGGEVVVATNDGNLLVMGSAMGLQKWSVFGVKTTTDGEPLWQKEYGGDAPYNSDYPKDLIELSDGGFGMVARASVPTPIPTEQHRVRVLKIDGVGDVV
jgi:hypothetical protein